MKKIITALGKEDINIELKKEKNFEIITGDIQYKEGILEVLENNQDIDFIILNSLLSGNIDTKELINKINNISRKIKIIIFLEKPDDEFERYLFENKIYKILYNNEIGIKDLINIINNDQLNNEELKQEIENLKELLLKKENNIDKIKIEQKRKNNNKNNNNKIKNKLIFKLNKFFNNINKNEAIKLNIKNKLNTNNKINKNIQYENDLQKKSGKIICILGTSGVGKSIISVNLAKANIYSKNKILIIDFDSINYSINTILGVKKTNIKSIENNSYLVSKALETGKEIFGDKCFIEKRKFLSGDNASIYFTKTKGVLVVFLAALENNTYPLHHPKMDLNDKNLIYAVETLYKLLLNIQ